MSLSALQALGSVLAWEFISEGARHDEPGIVAVFEKRPNKYSRGRENHPVSSSGRKRGMVPRV